MKILSIIGAILILYLLLYSGGNFYHMRKVAFSEFHTFLKESGDIEPSLFSGPALDLTSEKNLIFKWYYYNKEENDSLKIIVFVPPWFSSFNASVGGTGGKPETWKRLAGTREKKGK